MDGPQRLTTFIIFVQAFVEVVCSLEENERKSDEELYISDTLSMAAFQDKFLFKMKPPGDAFRTYKFGYKKCEANDELLSMLSFRCQT